MTPEQILEFEKKMKNRPHVVILGAGASVAAIPNGDANKKRISIMNDFFHNIGLDDLQAEISKITTAKNLEDIYSEIYERKDCAELKDKIEDAIYSYFQDIKIPEYPTIYDFLLLALRKKDLIATFNWDPLLLQAYQRVARITKDLPDLAFLHGNVLVGVCEEHKQGGYIYNKCSKCNNWFTPVKLLYPIKVKNYNSNLYIKDSWNILQRYLQRAYVITIFGYGAPPSDVEAIKMLKEAWGDTNERNLEQTEIIDIKSNDELYETWKPFINSHHYEIHNSFFDSTIANYPRRTCECLFDNLMNCKFLDSEKGFNENMGWKDIREYLIPILDDEKINNDKILTDFWIRN